MTESARIPHDLVTERCTDALRRHAGRGKPISVERLAEATGIKARTIASYREGAATPGLVNLLALMAALPPAFANEVLAMAGLGRAERLEGPSVDSFAVQAELTDAAAMIADHLRDGKVDHREYAEQVQRLRALADVIVAFCDSDDEAAPKLRAVDANGAKK